MAYWEEEEEEEEDENEGYLASYSDLVTDLMAVFVLLLSFALMSQGVRVRETAEKLSDNMSTLVEDAGNGNATDVDRFVERLEETIRLAGLEGELSVNRDFPEDDDTVGTGTEEPGAQMGEVMQTPENRQSTPGPALDPVQSLSPIEDSVNDLFESIRSYIEENGLAEQLSVMRQGENRILVRVKSSVFFASGSADINVSSGPLLVKISEILKTYTEFITMFGIEGHTDNVPIKNSHFDSNWELSTSRAVNVLRRILDISKLDPAKFSAVGYGEFHPVAGNDTEEGKSQNRRVDFIIETVSD